MEKTSENIPAKTELTPEWDAELHVIVNSVKRKYADQDRQDCVQEARIWWLTHQEWVERYLSDGEVGEKKLKVAIFRHVRKFCASERAKQRGYKPEDMYHYNTAALRYLLPKVFDYNDWVSTGQALSEDIKSSRPANESGGLLASLADVSRGMDGVREQDRHLLTLLYRDGCTEAELAEHFDITPEALNTRHDRALARLRDVMGGEQSYHDGPGARRAESNATALVRRHMQEEGSWTPRTIRPVS